MKYAAKVVSGRGEGRKLGFPTINLQVPAGLEATPGVYAGTVWIDGEPMAAAFHFGPVPTFGIRAASLEAHVIDRDIPHAPEELEFELGPRLRDVMRFDTPEDLVRQIAADVDAVRHIAAT